MNTVFKSFKDMEAYLEEMDMLDWEELSVLLEEEEEFSELIDDGMEVEYE